MIVNISFQITLRSCSFLLLLFFETTTTVALNTAPIMLSSGCCTTEPTKSLAAYAANQVATTILFNRLVAFWAWFGVDCEPVYSLRLIFALFVPESPHITGTRRMRFCHAIEAKLLPTNALDFTVGFAFHSNGIATVRNAGAPLDFCIVFNV